MKNAIVFSARSRSLFSLLWILSLPRAEALAAPQTSVAAWGYNESTVPANLTGVVAVASGGYHNLALLADGTVVAWGNNNYGQSTVPANLSEVVAISAGGAHNLALKGDASVVAWGDNEFGQIAVPANLGRVVAIAAGANHNLALKADGTVVAWGWNANG